METKIVNTFKSTKGSIKIKCLAICNLIGVDLEFCTRKYLESKRQKGVNGCTDGKEIMIINLKDKFDLFTFLHEVGHCILHHFTGLNENDYLNDKIKFENEANEFAENIMLKIYGNSIKSLTLACKI